MEMNNSIDFKVGDWVVYLPEPEKEFEIIATPEAPYKLDDGEYPNSISVAPGCDFLLRRGGKFGGFEPYKSVRKRDLRIAAKP